MRWYESGMYESLEKFNNFMQYRIFRRNRGTHSIKSLISMIKKQSIDGIESFIELNDDVPDDIIPIGRDEQILIDRDYTFYMYTKKFLEENPELKHTLIIGLTGHEAAIAAALSERGIPCSWNINLKEENTSEARVLEMLQDYAPIIEKNSCSDLSNMALILEVQHGFNKNTELSRLPSLEFLRQRGIKKCIFLTEAPYQAQSWDGYQIKDYQEALKMGGIDVSYFGVGDRKGDKADFSYFDVTRSIDPSLYLSNFNRQREKENVSSEIGKSNKSISTLEIGEATVLRANTADKRIVELTFKEWMKRMTEKGIIKDDR